MLFPNEHCESIFGYNGDGKQGGGQGGGQSDGQGVVKVMVAPLHIHLEHRA